MALSKKGMATLSLIAASSAGFAMLTQAEGKELVEAGLATVDTTNVEGDKAAVSLTDAGKALLPSGEAPAAPAGGYEIETGIEMPTTSTRKGRESGYPFDKLEIGQSFHVAKTAENPDPASRLASSVSGARVKYSVPTGETETVTKRVYKKAAGGGYEKDAEGKRIVESETQVERPKMQVTRDFACKTVDATDPKGEGARVWRTK